MIKDKLPRESINGSVPKTSNEIFTKQIGSASNSTIKTTLMMKSVSAGNSPAVATSTDNRETYNGNSYEKLLEHFKWANRYLLNKIFYRFSESFRALEMLCETYKAEYTTTFKDLETYKTEIVNLRKELSGVTVSVPFSFTFRDVK